MNEIKSEILTAKKKTSAKNISKWSMIIAGVWISVLSIIKAFWSVFVYNPTMKFGLTMDEIIFSGVTLAAIFTPVYLSIILDKIKDMKIGK